MEVLRDKIIAFSRSSEDVRIDEVSSRTREDKNKQRHYLVSIFALFFAITGIGLLAIAVISSDSLIRSSAMDFFKLWLGSLISIVSIMSTYYFRDEN